MSRVEFSAASRQRGFVLIATLWVMVILGVMLTHLGYQVRAEAQVERRALNQSQLRWAARGAVHWAAAQVREHIQDDYHSPADEWWSDEALYRDQAFGEARVSLLRASRDGDEQPVYGLDDEESRLNVNVARPEYLTGFAGVSSALAEDIILFRLRLEEKLQQAGVDKQEPSRDASDERTKNDEQSESTEGDGEGDGDGNEATSLLVQGPVRSLRELLAVEGVTEALLFDSQDGQPPLASLLTTVSSGKVNVNTAPTEVLSALGFDEQQLEAVLARRAQEEKNQQQKPQGPFTSVDEVRALFADEPDSKRLQRLLKRLDVRSSTFRLAAKARLPQQRRPYHVEATLADSGGELAFIRWREF